MCKFWHIYSTYMEFFHCYFAFNNPKHNTWSNLMDWCLRQTCISLWKFPCYGTRAHPIKPSLKTLMYSISVVSTLLFNFVLFFSCWCMCCNLKLLHCYMCHSGVTWALAIAAMSWACQSVQLYCMYVTNNTKLNSCSFIFPGNSPTPLCIWSSGQDWKLFSGQQLNFTLRWKCDICLRSRIALLFNFIALLMRANQGRNDS